MNLNRREFLSTASVISLGSALPDLARSSGAPSAGSNRKMTICLNCGAIGVSANQAEAIRLAGKHGFESVEAYPDYLANLGEAELSELQEEMKSKGLVFAAAGLPVEFRREESRFTEGLSKLPRLAAGLKRAGVSRVGTWLTPCDNSMTYLQHFKQLSSRLRQVATVLKDHGLRLGLEYVGTKTLRARCRYPFIHTMAETKELIAEIGTGNVGFVPDSWHWWQADDTVEDLLSLKNADIVAVDLNDAPAGVAKDQQVDGKRELPATTGVIDVAAFLRALQQVGYDGPVRAEPFNKPLNDLNNEEACAATAAAMKKAFAALN